MVLELTDQNFEEEIQKAGKPVLVDFWAQWCQPCFILAPILEKVAGDYKDKLILAKADLDRTPNVAQKLGINQIPTVILFKKGKPLSGFIGVRPEPAVKELLDKMLADASEKPDEIEKVIQGYREFAEKNGFKLNPDQEAVKRLAKGLLENEKKYGQRYCPCRRVSGNPEEDKKKICPCDFMRSEIAEQGHCLCGLFFKKQNGEKPAG